MGTKISAKQIELLSKPPPQVHLVFDSTGISLGVPDHTGQIKKVQYGAVSGLLASATAIDFGLLPPNTRYLKTKEDGVVIVIEVPAQKYRLLCHSSVKIEEVPLPAALFCFNLKRNPDNTYKINKCYIYGIATDNIRSLYDPLYHYPVSNINADYSICWGYDQKSANAYNYQSLAAVEGAISSFFDHSHNGHNFDQSRVSDVFDWNFTKKGSGIMENLFYRFKELGHFSPSWLRKVEGQTLATVLAKM